ncbi:MAG: DUF424 family protein [Candidatus Altiarchaeota archaeon]
MFYVKVHAHEGEVLVAACDKEILGDIISEGELELHVKERFYGGEVKDDDELAEILSTASIANLVGNRAVAAAINLGHVNPENTLTIDGIKHAQFTIMEE